MPSLARAHPHPRAAAPTPSRSTSRGGGRHHAPSSSTRRWRRAPSPPAPPPARRSSRASASSDDLESSSSAAALAADAAARCADSWERFYRTHAGKDGRHLASDGRGIAAFKDRHYLRREFAELMPDRVRLDPTAWPPAIDPRTTRAPNPASPDRKTVLELGCGVGNSAFPLMRANLDMSVVCADCSPTAIHALRANPEFDPRRCEALCVDLGAGERPLEGAVRDASVDAVTGVFFFSALDADAFARVARECARVLKPGGAVLFRDYAADDVKNRRPTTGEEEDPGEENPRPGVVGGASPSRGGSPSPGSDGGASSFAPGERLGDGDAHVRADGTLAVFSDEAAVASAFEAAGLRGECRRVTHTVVNRKLGVRLERHFVQGRFEKG